MSPSAALMATACPASPPWRCSIDDRHRPMTDDEGRELAPAATRRRIRCAFLLPPGRFKKNRVRGRRPHSGISQLASAKKPKTRNTRPAIRRPGPASGDAICPRNRQVRKDSLRDRGNHSRMPTALFSSASVAQANAHQRLTGCSRIGPRAGIPPGHERREEQKPEEDPRPRCMGPR